MKAFSRIFEVLQNPDGSLSSRRTAGLLLLILAGYGFVTGKDPTLTGVIFGLGATLLGLTTADKQAPPGTGA